MRKAVILAGGQGQRLRPLTIDRPKCMVEVLGMPLIAYQIQWLKTYQVENIIVCCGYQYQVISAYLGNGEKFGVKIQYNVEETPLGRGGALKSGLRELAVTADEYILAVNGDVITNLSLFELAGAHKQSNALATVVTVPLRSPFGIIDRSPNGLILGFREKPLLPYWINAGIYSLKGEIFEFLPEKGDHEELTFPQLAAEGKLASFAADIFWKPVDTVKDLGELGSELEKFLMGALFKTPAPT